jgi:PAS domain S-box-containing protein
MGKQPADDSAELAEVYRVAPVGLGRQDTDFKYRYINEWLARINGLSVEQHIGNDMRVILPQVAAGVELQMLRVLETGEPVVNSTRSVETAAHLGVKRLYQYSLFPVKSSDGTVIGVDSVVADITEVFAGYARDISKHEATEDLRSRFVERVFTAQAHERRRIAVDLHDGVCQMLSAARLRIESSASDSNAEDLSIVSKILQQSIEDIRAISQNLHPTILDDLGVVAAINNSCQDLAESGSVQVDFENDDFPDSLPEDMQNHLFRLVQEALQNAARHSNCERIAVSLKYENSVLELRIKDDGVGFDPEDQFAESTGSGIMNMKERTRFLGAELSIDSSPRSGTQVRVRVPWPPTE